MNRRPLWALLTALIGLQLVSAPTANAGASQFPAGYQGYHTYAEVNAELDNVVATYGQGSGAIVKRFLLGQSFEGRNIWGLKISDNAATDENEPEVLSECGMHSREHITVEMCLYMINVLTQNYGSTTKLGKRVTNIVNSREIWIIPSLNPDGAEYDIAGGTWHNWRKNRQVIPGLASVGIDLNRNWDYMWGCCSGSSAKPKSAQYRGQYPFQATEDALLRDFILGRKVGGVQQLSVVLNVHSYGEFIMWPYGYTKTDIPPTMTVDDHSAFVALAHGMAALNGYTTHQGSDSYIYDGDFPAWGYGDQRMFVFTWEMYPAWGAHAGGFHPPDTVIEREVTRNRSAFLYALEQADCPYRAAGLEATLCGPLNENFETDRGWTVDPNGTDDATDGAWQRGVPAATSDGGGAKQLGDVTSGQADLATGLGAGADAGANDLDGGTTSALSHRFTLGSGGGGAWTLSFNYTFAHDAAANGSDFMRVSVVDGSTTTPVWWVTGQNVDRNGAWQAASEALDAWSGQSIRLLVEARDGGADNLVEAAVDDIRVYQTGP